MPTAPRSRNSRSPRRAVRPRLEALEPRLALTASATLGAAARAAIVGDTLMVEGTPGPDRIRIVPTQAVGTVGVVSGGKVLGSFGPVANLDVNAGAGADTVLVDQRITLPASVDGGAGNDRVQGGSGPNVLLGGAGNDTLIGNPSRDTFDGGPGRNRSVFLKSLGVVQVGPSAAGAALRGLSGSYALSPLRVAGPAVVGAADLRNGRIANQLINDYNGGQTVSLANATPDTAAALASMLGYPAPAAFPAGVTRADLVTFRKTSQGGRTVFDTSLLQPVVNVPTTPAQRLAGNRANAQTVRTYLAGVFTAAPPITAPPPIAGPEANLVDLANQYNYHNINSNSHGDNVEIFNTVYAARSFLNQEDLYYVSQEVSDHIADTAIGQAGNPPFPPYAYASWGNGVSNTLTGLNASPIPVTIQPGPQTSLSATTETSGVSFTIGGSVGFNQAQGFNVGLNGSVTISNSTTKTIPPMNITYQGNPANALTQWAYEVPHEHLPQPSQTMTFATGWIWDVPFSAYAPKQDHLTFESKAGLGYANPLGKQPPADTSFWTVGVDLTSSVPFPFGTNFQLGSPKVTSVSPATVKPGDPFTIVGQALYPATVQAVLIKGQSLSTANFKPVSDTQINGVAPNTPGTALPVVVQTSQGTSNADVTINIVGTTQLHVQAQPVAAVAGQAFTNQPVATFTDSDPNAKPADFTAMIDWGDGKTSDGTITAAGSGTFDVAGSHTYATAGSYTFGVQVTDSSGNKAMDNSTATVSPMLQPPHVTGVNPDAINEGEKFTITGTGFYPNLVTSVLIGGQKLAPTQFSTVSDTQINAVAPAIHGNFLPVVVQTTQGVSNDDVTIRIHP